MNLQLFLLSSIPSR